MQTLFVSEQLCDLGLAPLLFEVAQGLPLLQ